MNKIKSFFNKPAPIIITLLLIIFALTMYISNYNSKIRIYVGSLNTEEVQIANVHIFTNGDINYFYASPANYTGKEKIYKYEIGYYVENSNDLVPFAVRSNTFSNANSLKEVVEEMSAWSFAEFDRNSYRFKKEIKRKVNKLHFVIRASTKKDSTNFDINIDKKVSETKITK